MEEARATHCIAAHYNFLNKFGYIILLSTVALARLEDRRGLLHSQLVAALSKLALACANSWPLALAGGP